MYPNVNGGATERLFKPKPSPKAAPSPPPPEASAALGLAISLTVLNIELVALIQDTRTAV